MADNLLDKVLGAVIGATIGDSIGAVVEFNTRENMKKRLGGKEWIENMHSFMDIREGPFGVFKNDPPRGTGTDDTRLNQIFLESVIRNKSLISSQLLAIEYINRYQNPENYYPKTIDLAKRHMSYFYPVCCAYLGMKDLDISEVKEHPIYLSDMNGFPMLSGLLSLQSAGLLYQDEPIKAYEKTIELDLFDIGYAKDATAILSAMVSSALSSRQRSASEIIDNGIKTNPYRLGGSEGKKRIMTCEDPFFQDGPSLPRLFRAVDRSNTDREAVLSLARESQYLHPFDPLDILGVPMAIIRYTEGDPVRSLLMAANHRNVDEKGNLVSLRDIDCVAMVTGVLVGAMNGVESFPKNWVKDVISANIDVYGFNIEKTAKKFYKTVYGKNSLTF